MADDKVVQLETSLLEPNPIQPRGTISEESISDLIESIRQQGVLEPLIVAKTPAGYQIISGERRWRAAKHLKLEKIPVIIKEVTPKEMIEMILANNVQREELNPLDRAKAFKKMKDEFNLKWSEIAKKIGKSSSYVVNTVKLLTLPDALKDGLLSGLISEGHARALSSIEDTRLMIEGYKIVLREQASVRRAEEISRRIKLNMLKREKESSGTYNIAEFTKSELDKIAESIKRSFPYSKLEVEITQSKVRATIRITIDSEPEKTNKFVSDLSRRLTENS